MIGDYFHCKKAVQSSLLVPLKISKPAPKVKGSKHQPLKDLIASSDLTRTQLTDAIWHALFQEMETRKAALTRTQLADAIWQALFREMETRGEALCGGPPKLDSVQEVRKKGRKRKHAS